MSEEFNVMGFTIESLSLKGEKAIKKNARVPIIMRTIIASKVISNNPYIVEIKLRGKLFKKNKNDHAKKLIINSAENLISAVKQEMTKCECDEDIDYNLEVIRE